MSASAGSATRTPHTERLPGGRGWRRIVRASVWAVIAIAATVLTTGLIAHGPSASVWAEILVWSAAVAVAGLAAIQTTEGPQLGLDMPILLAAGYVMGPIPAGVIAVAGYVDLREFRGQIRLERALFNRAQTSLSVVAATLVYSWIGESSGFFVLAAVAAVVVDSILNFGMIAAIMVLAEGVPTRVSLSRLRFGSLLTFAGTYACFGLLSLLLAEVYVAAGAWSLLLFVTPLVLARQAMSNTRRLALSERRLRIQSTGLRDMSDQMVRERREERLSIAAGLHDDVMPPLFRVHLLGQVLRREMATGQLLAMEDDLPSLLRATDDAREIVREQIRGLRSSSLGTEGLSRTLRLLVRQLECESQARFVADVRDVSATPVVELLAYQVGREALRNAIRHSGAASILLSLVQEGGWLSLTVRDDGRGFLQADVDESAHFGLALMRERVALVGGTLTIDSGEGRGTTVIVRFPVPDGARA
jgi:signal transduction histidine kinase